MKTFLKVVGYGILILIVCAGAFFGVMYSKYTSQSKDIHAAVNTFITASKNGDVETLEPIVYPAFAEQLGKLLSENQELFAHISGIVEKTGYFSYSMKSGVGETTEYQGDLLFDTGDVSDVVIKLIKSEGKWMIYGLDIVPKSEAKS